MRMVAGSILVLSGTIASSVACFLGEAYTWGKGIPAAILSILGILQLISGAWLVFTHRAPAG